MKHSAIFALLYVSLVPLHAGNIDVTTDSQVTVQEGESLIVGLGVWNYASQAAAAGLASPYPTEISFTLGGLPVGLLTSTIPGSSATYTPGLLFSATLESLDGTVSVPLFDSNAALLGLPDGDLVLGSGFRSGGSYSGPISVLSATVMLTSAESAELFSAAALEPWSEAFVIRLANVGEDVTFGYSGSPITGALSASLSSENGTLSVGAMPIQVELQNCPEPGTLGLLLMGLMASLWLKWRANRVPFAILREGVVRREGSRITARAGYTEICFPNERYRDN
jgi:hypothetical protein